MSSQGFRAGFVSIVGRPNAGKSTLMNALLGQKISIVSPKAQTTRDSILGILTTQQGQIVFEDTPGVHRAKEGGINQVMIHAVEHALLEPHLIWYIVDPDFLMKQEDVVIKMMSETQAPIFVIFNKSDLKKANHSLLIERLKETCPNRLMGEFVISAKTKKGLSELLEKTFEFMTESQPYFQDPDQVSDKPTRFFAAELIREKLYECLGEEIPYSCAVEIVSFEETTTPIKIQAVIHVERESQKGMVIGKQAKKIKEIGTLARVDIESFLGARVFLGLQVKVTRDWSKKKADLKRLGYAS